ncbi:MAG: hypothetical protein CMB80_12475 [Flammeovirgaceae bacterium]|nr:hypothetical protein [Flammeovirgaceae bacterium]|tara:strand:- start:1176 stop:2204 length:1029 start_codon:yes stop_codon:yes gene_type:complete
MANTHALTNADAVQNILNTVAFPEFQKAFNNSSAFLGQVPFQAGKARIQIPMHKTGMDVTSVTSDPNDFTETADEAGAFPEGQLIPAGSAQGRQTVEWEYKSYGTTIAIEGMVQAKASAGGYNALSDMLAEELLAGVDDLKHVISQDALGVGTDNSSGMDGVTDIISASNTVAGVSQGSNAWFASYVYDPADDASDDDTALTVALMDDVFQNLTDVRSATPDAIWTSFAQYNAYANLMSDRIRYVPYGTGDARFQGLNYNGIPVIAVPKYNATRMDFVQTSDWSLNYLPQKSYSAEGKLVEGAFKVESRDGAGYDAISYTVVAYLSLVCRNPFKQGCLIDLE